MVILDNFVHQQFSTTKMTLETCSSRISRLIIGVFGLKIGMGMGRDCQSQGLLGQPEFFEFFEKNDLLKRALHISSK